MAQVVPEQHTGRGGVGNDAFAAGLGRLRPDPQRAVRGIDVVGAQRAQLLAAQRRVIGQRQHQPVADRLATEHLQQLQPLALGRDPRQLDHPRHQRPGAAAEVPAGGVAAAADRVGVPQPFLDQEVVEQPHRHQPLLQAWRSTARPPSPARRRWRRGGAVASPAHARTARPASGWRSADRRRRAHRPAGTPPAPARRRRWCVAHGPGWSRCRATRRLVRAGPGRATSPPRSRATGPLTPWCR